MDLFIVYEGQRAKAGKIAEMLAERVADVGIDATAIDLDEAHDIDVTSADALAIGCGAKVDTPFGGDSTTGLASWIAGLPDLRGMPVVVFCTYRFFPNTFADVTTRTAEILSGLEAAIGRRDGTVISSHAINRRHPEEGLTAVVEDVQREFAA